MQHVLQAFVETYLTWLNKSCVKTTCLHAAWVLLIVSSRSALQFYSDIKNICSVMNYSVSYRPITHFVFHVHLSQSVYVPPIFNYP